MLAESTSIKYTTLFNIWRNFENPSTIDIEPTECEEVCGKYSSTYSTFFSSLVMLK